MTWVEFADKHFLGLSLIVLFVTWVVGEILIAWLRVKRGTFQASDRRP
jgi:hypothetical protein